MFDTLIISKNLSENEFQVIDRLEFKKALLQVDDLKNINLDDIIKRYDHRLIPFVMKQSFYDFINLFNINKIHSFENKFLHLRNININYYLAEEPTEKIKKYNNHHDIQEFIRWNKPS